MVAMPCSSVTPPAATPITSCLLIYARNAVLSQEPQQNPRIDPQLRAPVYLKGLAGAPVIPVISAQPGTATARPGFQIEQGSL